MTIPSVPPANQPPSNPPPAGGEKDEPIPDDSNWRKVQVARAVVGLFVVAVGVGAIAFASYWGISHATSKDATSIVAILSSAFTAIATTTTAYFGIRAATNTAQSVAEGKSGVGKASKPGIGTT